MSIDLQAVFGRDQDILIGMVHVGALPGTPGSRAAPTDLVAQAVDEARLLADAGFDAVMLENMHDTPYLLREVGPEIVSTMTAVTRAVRDAISLPLGVQVLAAANRAALAVAHAAGATFIRAEGFCYAAVADEGLMAHADAGPLLRYRRSIGAEHVAILADIHKKHTSHALTADLNIADWAGTAEFMGADGVIITGTATGEGADLDEAAAARDACDLPVFIGSGVSSDTLVASLDAAHGVIVGSAIKTDGHWVNPVEATRAGQFVQARISARA